GMCLPLLKAQGKEIGDSLLEPDQLDAVQGLLARAADSGVRIALPSDVVVARQVSADAERRTVSADAIEPGWRGLDIGPDTAARFAEQIRDARTVFWNGPMGVFEVEPFAAGTR